MLKICLKINAQSLKRTLNRRVEKAIVKQTRLDNLASVVNNRYNESDSDQGNSSSNYQDVENNSINLEMDEEKNENVNTLCKEDLSSEIDSEIDKNNNNETSDSIGSSDEDSSSYDSNDSENNSDSEKEKHLQFANENEIGQYVVKILRQWVQEGGVISMRRLNSLLAKLHHVFPEIPLSYKTLLQTPIQIDINQINGGELWYKGIAFNLDLMNLEEYLQIFNEIVIDINVDGLSLFKSSSERFWPILGKLVRSKNEPFIIAIFKGNKDPIMNDLLNNFVIKVANLNKNGYVRNGTSYRFSIRHYILDAPARSKVKCCIEHGGYYEKCEVVGKYIDNRMTYIELDENLRTNQSFFNQEQPYHHTGRSQLEVIGAGLVSQFRLDSFHLVYLGVFKRLILAWKKWNGPWKLHNNTIKNISHKLLILKGSCPRDFNRPPRSLEDLPFFKATEFRRILLYDGILVFKDSVADKVYKHFLLLHCAIYILNSPSLMQIYCD